MTSPTQGTNLGDQVFGVLGVNGKFSPVLTLHGWQAIAAATNDGTDAFLATTSTNMDVADWRIYAGRKGEMKLIADSNNLIPGKTPPSPETQPIATDGQEVYWSAPQFLQQSKDPNVAGIGFRSDIVAASVTGDERPHVLIKGAFMPAATREGLWYVQGPAAGPDQKGPFTQIRRRLRSGQDSLEVEVSRREEEIGSICVSRDRLGWTTASAGHHDKIHVRDRLSGQERVISTSIGAHGASVWCGKGFVTWGAGSDAEDTGEYLLRAMGDEIETLARTEGAANVMAQENYIGWRIPTNPNNPPTRVARVRSTS